MASPHVWLRQPHPPQSDHKAVPALSTPVGLDLRQPPIGISCLYGFALLRRPHAASYVGSLSLASFTHRDTADIHPCGDVCFRSSSLPTAEWRGLVWMDTMGSSGRCSLKDNWAVSRFLLWSDREDNDSKPP